MDHQAEGLQSNKSLAIKRDKYVLYYESYSTFKGIQEQEFSGGGGVMDHQADRMTRLQAQETLATAATSKYALHYE